MGSSEEKRIIEYLITYETITRFELDAVSVSLPLFLDIMARLKYKRLIETKQARINTKSDNPMIINKYFLSESGKQFYRYLFPETNELENA